MTATTKKSLLAKINGAVDQLRPYLQADGGDISVEDLTEDMVVRVKLKGACGTCPFSLYTLKAGVEQAIKREVPSVKEVVAIEE
jgi:Fe-S cluster biogenesis protein NfuA